MSAPSGLSGEIALLARVTPAVQLIADEAGRDVRLFRERLLARLVESHAVSPELVSRLVS